MSMFCNCRYCVAEPAPEIPAPPAAHTPQLQTDVDVIDFGCLVDEYLDLSDADFNLHWNAINKARDKKDADLYGEDDE